MQPRRERYDYVCDFATFGVLQDWGCRVCLMLKLTHSFWTDLEHHSRAQLGVRPELLGKTVASRWEMPSSRKHAPVLKQTQLSLEGPLWALPRSLPSSLYHTNQPRFFCGQSDFGSYRGHAHASDRISTPIVAPASLVQKAPAAIYLTHAPDEIPTELILE